MGLILKDWFWFSHVPFHSMVQFQSFAQFSVDLLPQPIVSNLLILLHSLLHSRIMWLFVSSQLTTWSSLAILSLFSRVFNYYYYLIFKFIFGFLQSFTVFTQDLAWGKLVYIFYVFFLCVFFFCFFFVCFSVKFYGDELFRKMHFLYFD